MGHPFLRHPTGLKFTLNGVVPMKVELVKLEAHAFPSANCQPRSVETNRSQGMLINSKSFNAILHNVFQYNAIKISCPGRLIWQKGMEYVNSNAIFHISTCLL